MRVYRIPFSTNVERVALATGAKGIDVQWVDVDPADRGTVRDLSGQDLVPVALFDDGAIVVDSLAIMEELERRHPEPPLYPRDEPRRAELRLFLEWFDRVWKGPPNELEAELRRAAPDAERVHFLERRLEASRPTFESLLAGRDYLFGEELSAADCAAFPFLRYGLLADERDDELFHRILAEHLRLDDRYPALAAWIRRVDRQPRA